MPLNALRAFEAAARLGGFLAAAEELGVTPGAVSQQIRALEDWAGAPLFDRRARGVALSPLGSEVAGGVSGAFDALGEAARRIRAGAGRRSLAIAALPAVAQLWLAPRMAAIRAALPGVEISISALETRPNLRREMFDLSLFLDRPRGGRFESVLVEDRIYPVCAPALARGIAGPQDLGQYPMIHDTAWPDDWALWAGKAGSGPEPRPGPGPGHSLYSLAVDEAKAGAGVLIGHDPLVAAIVAAGRLAALSPSVPSGLSLNLEIAPHQPADGPAGRLAVWIRDQVSTGRS